MRFLAVVLRLTSLKCDASCRPDRKSSGRDSPGERERGMMGRPMSALSRLAGAEVGVVDERAKVRSITTLIGSLNAPGARSMATHATQRRAAQRRRDREEEAPGTRDDWANGSTRPEGMACARLQSVRAPGLQVSRCTASRRSGTRTLLSLASSRLLVRTRLPLHQRAIVSLLLLLLLLLPPVFSPVRMLVRRTKRHRHGRP